MLEEMGSRSELDRHPLRSPTSYGRGATPRSEGTPRRGATLRSEGASRRGATPRSEGTKRRGATLRSVGASRRGATPRIEGAPRRGATLRSEGASRRLAAKRRDQSLTGERRRWRLASELSPPGRHPSLKSNSFRKSTLPQNRQLNVSVSSSEQSVANFVGEFTFYGRNIR